MIIDEAKCYLLNYGDLNDFNYLGAYAYEAGNGYRLVYNDLVIQLMVTDRIIVDYDYY